MVQPYCADLLVTWSFISLDMRLINLVDADCADSVR